MRPTDNCFREDGEGFEEQEGGHAVFAGEGGAGLDQSPAADCNDTRW